MSAIAERNRKPARPLYDPPLLENGARLTSREFLRRYEAMPEVKKAELIEGIVYLPPPVSSDHSELDSLIQTWLGTYAAHTPGLRCYTNTTVLLGPRNTPQPDACLCLKPGVGRQTRFNEKKYLVGAPELIAEIAATSASLDLGDKLEAYAVAGVREYLVWRTLEHVGRRRVSACETPRDEFRKSAGRFARWPRFYGSPEIRGEFALTLARR